MTLFYPPACPRVAIHKAFHYRYPQINKGGKLFQNIDYRYFAEVETDDSASADAIVLVNDFAKPLTDEARAYIKEEADRAERLHKPLFLFSCGDFSDTIQFDPRVWVFRYSLYRSTASPRDICVPMSTEDAPADLIFSRPKRDKPVVGFCGNGAVRSLRWGVSYALKNVLYELAGWIRPALRARKVGVYWRRALMRACRLSPLVETRFIVRRSFSGHVRSIELDPAQARREYLETTAESDFVLAPKGDGNYSNRFFKTLAFGRIPVVVDTDIVLPLEGQVEYSSLIVRVPMTQVRDTPALIRAWYDACSEEEWERRHERARALFLTRLNVDAFYRFFFSQVFPTLSS